MGKHSGVPQPAEAVRLPVLSPASQAASLWLGRSQRRTDGTRGALSATATGQDWTDRVGSLRELREPHQGLQANT